MVSELEDNSEAGRSGRRRLHLYETCWWPDLREEGPDSQNSQLSKSWGVVGALAFLVIPIEQDPLVKTEN